MSAGLKNQKINAADVKRSFNWDLSMEFSMRYFGRPVANFVTPLFHNAGWTANRVTTTRMFGALFGTALLAFPVPWLWLISASIFYVSVVLDCVDGHLARIQQDASYLGKFLDGIADMIFPLSAPFFAGIGCWLYFDQPILVVVGASISVISATNQMVRSRLSFTREWMVRQTGELTDSELEKAAKPQRNQKILAVVMVDGYFVAMAAVFIPEFGTLIFLFLALLLQLLPNIVWLGSTFSESNALLRRSRQSRHSPVASNDDPAVEKVNAP